MEEVSLYQASDHRLTIVDKIKWLHHRFVT